MSDTRPRQNQAADIDIPVMGAEAAEQLQLRYRAARRRKFRTVLNEVISHKNTNSSFAAHPTYDFELDVAMAAALGGSVDSLAAVPPCSPSRRKISEDLENTPSPHNAGVQRNISMPKPMKL